jgi:hypothetical protein
VHVVRRGKFFRDLVARVSTTDYEKSLSGYCVWARVLGTVDLVNLGREVTREGREIRYLERPGRDDNLIRLDTPVVQTE